MNTIYLLILCSLFLFQSPRSVQSIALSRLCGRFGHSCYGANWGKRAAPENLLSDLKKTNKEMAIDDNSMSHYVLEELRSELFRQRLRQLFGLKH